MYCNTKATQYRFSSSSLLRCHNHNSASAYIFNTSATSFAFCDLDFLSATDIVAIGAKLPVLLATF